MIPLLLTIDDRIDIDSVGRKFWEGSALRRLLWTYADPYDNELSWDLEQDILYSIPAIESREMKERLVEADYGGDNFNGDLREKLMRFCAEVYA